MIKKCLASVSQVDSVKLRMGIAIPYVPSSGTSDTAGTVDFVASMNQRITVDGKLHQLRLVFHMNPTTYQVFFDTSQGGWPDF